ncbi:DUF2690 domain-containing protein, partial [Streptomyces stramineus]
PAAAGSPGPPLPAAGERRGPGRGRWAFALSGAVAAAAAVTLTLVLTAGEQASGEPESGPRAAVSPYAQYQVPACKGEECDGADPERMGCSLQSMVVTLLTRRLPDGQVVRLRYNETCGTVWAKAMYLRLGDRVELSVPGAGTKEVKAASQRDTEQYLPTAMTATDDPYSARVCVRPAAGGGPVCFSPPAGPTAGAGAGRAAFPQVSGHGDRSSTPVGGRAAVHLGAW